MQKKPPSNWLIAAAVIIAIAVFATVNAKMNPMSEVAQEVEHVHDENCDHGHEHETASAGDTNKAALDKEPPPIDKEKVKKQVLVFETEKGTIKVRLFPEEMPVTVANFVDLVNREFYDGLTFHRVEDWVVQGGDPAGNGTGGSSRKIPLEINKKMGFEKPGRMGMARTQDPNSASCQFFWVTKDSSFLNDGYAMFGEVVEGMDVVKKIEIGDKMKTVRLVDEEAK